MASDHNKTSSSVSTSTHDPLATTNDYTYASCTRRTTWIRTGSFSAPSPSHSHPCSTSAGSPSPTSPTTSFVTGTRSNSVPNAQSQPSSPTTTEQEYKPPRLDRQCSWNMQDLKHAQLTALLGSGALPVGCEADGQNYHSTCAVEEEEEEGDNS